MMWMSPGSPRGDERERLALISRQAGRVLPPEPHGEKAADRPPSSPPPLAPPPPPPAAALPATPRGPRLPSPPLFLQPAAPHAVPTLGDPGPGCASPSAPAPSLGKPPGPPQTDAPVTPPRSPCRCPREAPTEPLRHIRRRPGAVPVRPQAHASVGCTFQGTHACVCALLLGLWALCPEGEHEGCFPHSSAVKACVSGGLAALVPRHGGAGSQTAALCLWRFWGLGVCGLQTSDCALTVRTRGTALHAVGGLLPPRGLHPPDRAAPQRLHLLISPQGVGISVCAFGGGANPPPVSVS